MPEHVHMLISESRKPVRLSCVPRFQIDPFTQAGVFRGLRSIRLPGWGARDADFASGGLDSTSISLTTTITILFFPSHKKQKAQV